MLPREPAAGRGRHWYLIQEPISYCQWHCTYDPLVTSRGTRHSQHQRKRLGEGVEGLRREMRWGAGRGRGREAAKRDQGIRSVLPIGEDFAPFFSCPPDTKAGQVLALCAATVPRCEVR